MGRYGLETNGADSCTTPRGLNALEPYISNGDNGRLYVASILSRYKNVFLLNEEEAA